MANMKKVEFKLPPLVARVKSLVLSKQRISPMFNQPLDTNSCPHHRKARQLYGISLVVLFIMALLAITFKGISYSFVEDNRMTGFVFETTLDGNIGESLDMAALPQTIYTLPTKLAIIIAAISLSVAGAHMGLVIVDWKSGKRTQNYAFRRNIMFVHLINAILILFAMIAMFVTHKNSSRFRESYIAQHVASMREAPTSLELVFRYDIGTFDLETWSCELKGVKGALMVQDDYAKQCAIEVAGRAILVPFALAAWCVAAVGIWSFIEGGRKGPDGQRIRTEEVGLEMEKMNARDE